MSKWQPGYDGNPPIFVPTKDLIGAGGKREQIDGPTNLNHTRLTLLLARGSISAGQARAGARLYKDWYLSRIDPAANSVMVGNGGSGGSVQLPNDAKVDAMKRHGEAMGALGMAWSIVEAVCCFEQRLDHVASRLKLNPQRAIGRLEAGLDVLRLHYAVVDTERRRRMGADGQRTTRD
jgi:hypothetical protein